MIATSQNGHDVLWHHAKFGEIELWSPALGAKYGVFSVTLRVRRAVRSRGHILNRYCVTVYGRF